MQALDERQKTTSSGTYSAKGKHTSTVTWQQKLGDIPVRSHQAAAYPDLGIREEKPCGCPPKTLIEDEVETLCRMVDEGYDFTLIAEKLNRTALATRGKYERLQNPEYNKRYNRGQNEDYEYQGIRSISGKDILKDRELMDGAEFQELEPVANK